jgi:Transposase DDE domain
MLKLGTVALDGTKIHANASRHSALSYERAGQIEMQLREEVGKLTAMAEAADQADVVDGMSGLACSPSQLASRSSIPEELARREKRLTEIARARAIIEARAKERYARERAEHEAKMAAREARSAETGKNPGGRPPAPPVEAPGPADQVNLTDEESRIMPIPHSDTLGVRQPNAKMAGGGFEQCYSAQAVVAEGSLLVVAGDVVQATNDKQQVQPMLEALAALPGELGKAETLLADTGYFSEANVNACAAAGIDPLIAQGKTGQRFRRA